jgi:hypothetical protein
MSCNAINPAGSSLPALIRFPVVNCLNVLACAAEFRFRMFKSVMVLEFVTVKAIECPPSPQTCRALRGGIGDKARKKPRI